VFNFVSCGWTLIYVCRARRATHKNDGRIGRAMWVKGRVEAAVGGDSQNEHW